MYDDSLKNLDIKEIEYPGWFLTSQLMEKELFIQKDSKWPLPPPKYLVASTDSQPCLSFV
jgi:hypothetical protein